MGKEIEIGTCRAKLTVGLIDRFPVGGQQFIRFDIILLTRFQTYRETIKLTKQDEKHYATDALFYKGVEEVYRRVGTLAIAETERRPAPPMATSIPKETQHHELNALLQLEAIQPVDGMNELNANKQIAMNVYYSDKGSQPAHDKYSSELLAIADLNSLKGYPDVEVVKQLSEIAKNAQAQTTRSNLGDEVGVDQRVWRTTPPVTLDQPTADGIIRGTSRIYMYIWATWKDSENYIGTLTKCYWLQTPTSRIMLLSNLVWHTCSLPIHP
jgi:hypothetical protein